MTALGRGVAPLDVASSLHLATVRPDGRPDADMQVMIIWSSHTPGQSESTALSSGVARVKLSTS